MTKLQSQINLVLTSNIWAMNPFVKVNLAAENGFNGPNVSFVGINLHLISGAGTTGDGWTGLGNLCIGYQEQEYPGWLQPGDRAGSHNLIMGWDNRFSARTYASIITGEYNTVDGIMDYVIGGGVNNVTANYSVLVGGNYGQLGGQDNLMGGGTGNVIQNTTQVVLFGGDSNSVSTEWYDGFGTMNGIIVNLNGIP